MDKKEPIKLNKKAKIINAIIILVLLLALAFCSYLKLWYIPLALGVILFIAVTIIDILVKNTLREIDKKNKEFLSRNKNKSKLGKISLKDYIKLMNGEGVVLEDGTPIFESDIKDE